MTDLHKAAQQALEALETLVPTKGPSVYNSARDALKVALAQQAEPVEPAVVSVDELANHIRVVDGNHSLGAGALAEKIVEFLIKRAHGIGEQP